MLDNKSKFRIIISSTQSAAENMAEDESLLKSFKDNNCAILRVYTWEENSQTIGISQDITHYLEDKNLKGKIAKRITGGGVLFHGHDLSYSLVIPTHILSGLSIKKSYEMICLFLLNFYKKLGLNVCYAKDDENVILSKSDYCQIGFEAYDIIANGKKIGGNAQRRTKKAIFQHGSIPIKATKSNSFDEKIGHTLEDFNINIKFEEAVLLLIESFKESFNIDVDFSTLTEEEKKLKNSLLKEKYDTSC